MYQNEHIPFSVSSNLLVRLYSREQKGIVIEAALQKSSNLKYIRKKTIRNKTLGFPVFGSAA